MKLSNWGSGYWLAGRNSSELEGNYFQNDRCLGSLSLNLNWYYTVSQTAETVIIRS